VSAGFTLAVEILASLVVTVAVLFLAILGKWNRFNAEAVDAPPTRLPRPHIERFLLALIAADLRGAKSDCQLEFKPVSAFWHQPALFR
jgi:hypothetical protein